MAMVKNLGFAKLCQHIVQHVLGFFFVATIAKSQLQLQLFKI